MLSDSSCALWHGRATATASSANSECILSWLLLVSQSPQSWASPGNMERRVRQRFLRTQPVLNANFAADLHAAIHRHNLRPRHRCPKHMLSDSSCPLWHGRATASFANSGCSLSWLLFVSQSPQSWSSLENMQGRVPQNPTSTRCQLRC